MRNKHLRRVLTDMAGYALVLAGLLFGWLPGPGGIPLVLAGLSLLALNNTWAARLRSFILEHSGRLSKFIFPKNHAIQVGYDILTLILFVVASLLALDHAALWEISLSILIFVVALLITVMNRERYTRIKHKHE